MRWRWKKHDLGTRIALGFVLACALGLWGEFPLALQAQGKKSDSEVKVKAAASKVDASGHQVITMTLAINKGWHVYANPVGNSDLRSSQTVATVTSKAKLEEVKILYPPGKVVEDKVVGDYKVYKGQVNIQAQVKRLPGETGPLEVALRFMACHEKGVCLLPATVKLTVE